MGTATTTFTLTVQAQATTPLSQLVQDMQSEFGAASGYSNELQTPRYLGENLVGRAADATTIMQAIRRDGQSGLLDVSLGGREAWRCYNPGLSDTLLGGSGGPNKSQYDPVTGRWWHIVGTTGNSPYVMTVVMYDPERDEFRHWQGYSAGPVAGPFDPWGGPHSFGQSCIDPSGRKLFRLMTSPVITGQFRVATWDLETLTGSVGTNYLAANSNYPPIEFAPGVGSQGTIIALWNNPGLVSPIYTYDVDSGTWDTSRTKWPSVFMGGKPVTCVVGNYLYLTAEAADSVQRRFYRLDISSTGTSWEPLEDTPVAMNSNGNWSVTPTSGQTLFAPLNNKIYAFYAGESMATNPSTTGAVYEYDIDSDLWNPTPVDTLPTAPIAPANESIRQSYTIATNTDLGCVFYAAQRSDFAHWSCVWKPPG